MPTLLYWKRGFRELEIYSGVGLHLEGFYYYYSSDYYPLQYCFGTVIVENQAVYIISFKLDSISPFCIDIEIITEELY